MAVYEALSEEEKFLYVLLQDPSGIDLCEFALADEERDDGCWRAWPFQWTWLRSRDALQIDQAARSVGKSNSIAIRAMAFPFVHPGAEMLITAPEKVHLDAITNKIENWIIQTRLTREMLSGKGGRNSFKHQPFHADFANGSRLMGRIPQRDGRGVKGMHPLCLEQDEACFPAETLVLTEHGYTPIAKVEVGDRVLTHRNRWKRVKSVINNGTRPTVTVKGQGHSGLRVTANHRFWASRITKFHDTRNRQGCQERTPSHWVPASELIDCYWSSPLDFEPPAIDVPPIPGACTGKNHIQPDPRSGDFLWMLGLFLAEGSTSRSGSTARVNKATWSIHTNEVPEVTARASAAGLSCFVQPVLNSVNAKNVVVANVELASWLQRECGQGCYDKQIPSWVFTLDAESRQAVLDGMVYGDGHNCQDARYAAGRWKYSTTSKKLAYGIKLLAQSLGMHVSVNYKAGGAKGSIRGKSFVSGENWQVVAGSSGQGINDGHHRLTRIRSISEGQAEEVWDLEVEDDHSFVAEGIVVHNSDYPEPGWTELVETLKRGSEGAVWRAHGVTRGLRDSFYKFTQPGSGWKVHQITAMHRPNWTDAERQEKILQYGSKDAPDYRRNILGAHGDASSPMFVLHRLMACVDSDEYSDYNTDVYRTHRITGEMLEADPMHVLLQLHDSHRRSDRWLTHWIGADLGWTQAPTEILVFGEHRPNKAKASVLELIFRLNLTRVGGPDQVRAIQQLIGHYNPKAFAMDSTGAGLVLYQQLQEDPAIAKVVRGYNFKEKVLVDFDKSVEVDQWTGDAVRDAGIKRQVLEYSTDMLRKYVDEERLLLPWDRNLIGQFQGGSIQAVKAGMDEYGRRRISSSAEDHALDASRMAVLAHALHVIEAMMANQKQEPVFDGFMEF